MASASKLLGGNSTPLGGYELFSGIQPTQITTPSGQVFLKSGVIALLSAFPTVPANFAADLSPLVKVADIGSGDMYNDIAIDPVTGQAVIISDALCGGKLLRINGLSTTSTADVESLTGAWAVNGLMARFPRLVIHKDQYFVGVDGTVGGAGRMATRAPKNYPNNIAPVDTGGPSLVARRTLSIAADPSGNIVQFFSTASTDVHHYLGGAGGTYTLRALPWSGTVFASCYGGGQFVALADSGTNAATSPDGITWTPRTLPVSGLWRALAYGGGVYVALAFGGSVALSSTDGITWTQRTLPWAAGWQDVCYSSTLGLFVGIAVGASAVATSPDGINWTQRNLPSGAAVGWSAVDWSPALGAFLMTANDGKAGVMFSTDGITWQAKAMPRAINFANVISAGGSTLYAETGEASVSWQGYQVTLLAKSTDGGATWTYNRPNIPVYYSGSLRWCNDRLMAAICISPTVVSVFHTTDGVTWTRTDITVGLDYSSGVKFDCAYSAGKYCVMPSKNITNTLRSTLTTATPATAGSWTENAGALPASTDWNYLIVAGSNLVALGANGGDILAYSTNGGVSFTASAGTLNAGGNVGSTGGTASVLRYDPTNSTVYYRSGGYSYFAMASKDFGATFVGIGANQGSYEGFRSTQGSNGTWTRVDAFSLSILSNRDSAPIRSYSHGASLASNSGYYSVSIFPLYISGINYFHDGKAFYRQDTSGQYIDNTAVITESSGTGYYYMRVK